MLESNELNQLAVRAHVLRFQVRQRGVDSDAKTGPGFEMFENFLRFLFALLKGLLSCDSSSFFQGLAIKESQCVGFQNL